MANWVSRMAAALEAVADAQNPYITSSGLHSRYGGIMKEMYEFYRFWTRERGGRYHATEAEVEFVGIRSAQSFDWVCEQLPDSVIGLMYAAIVQANNNKKGGFVEKSMQAVDKLDKLIGLSTQRCGAYQLMRQKWIEFHRAELRRLK